MSESNSKRSGIGFAGMLTILFIGLKLTNHIAWSWWWVLSPLWIPLAIVLAIVFVVAFFALVAATIGMAIEKINKK